MEPCYSSAVTPHPCQQSDPSVFQRSSSGIHWDSGWTLLHSFYLICTAMRCIDAGCAITFVAFDIGAPRFYAPAVPILPDLLPPSTIGLTAEQLQLKLTGKVCRRPNHGLRQKVARQYH